jgi:hypothetical protein
MFRTEITIPASSYTLALDHRILTTGSCFSDEIGRKLGENKFTVSTNPFGTAYNPVSIHKTLRYTLHNQALSPHTFVHTHGLHCNYDFHSRFSSLEKPPLEKQLQETIGATHYFLKDTHWLLITYGTAWVYERKDTGEVVSNCHKVPATHFDKLLLSQKRILEDFQTLNQELLRFNPGLQIMLTVSPVRHIKDTLTLNSVSKSVLRLACHTLAEIHSHVHYFPSYEIMTDDLRDYRFYNADLIHPNDQAIEYIWQKFSETYFTPQTKATLRQWQSIRQALQHKPFHPQSAGHQHFLKETLSKLKSIQQQINVEEEIKLVESQIINA